MTQTSADRVDLRLSANSVALAIVCATVLTAAILAPSYRLLPLAVILAWPVFRLLTRQATSIAFDADGFEVRLLLRKRYVRRPVAEFSGSRRRGVQVHDLHDDKTYDLAQFPRSRRLIDAAERHGYAVLARPRTPEY